jgi:hypothetical protein
MGYADTAYAYAKKNGLTAEQVEGMSYRDFAGACGVKVEANGDSPSDFFYAPVRKQVTGRLFEEESTTAAEARLTSILNKTKELPAESNTTAEFIPEGKTSKGPFIAIREVK